MGKCCGCLKERATTDLIMEGITYALCAECWDLHHRANEQAITYVRGRMG